MKNYCYLLTLALLLTSLLPTCLLAADRSVLGVLESASKHRNEIEENWHWQRNRYSPNDEVSMEREAKRSENSARTVKRWQLSDTEPVLTRLYGKHVTVTRYSKPE
jgi:hypothetical protein